MGTFCRLGFLRLGRGGRARGHALRRVALVCMLMDAVCHKGITVLGVFMAAWRSLAALGVAALVRVLWVVFTQTGSFALCRLRQCCNGDRPQNQHQAEQHREESSLSQHSYTSKSITVRSVRFPHSRRSWRCHPPGKLW